MKKTILSVTAHPDDEVLGFGATAKKLSMSGHQVYNCFLSGNAEERGLRPNIVDFHNDIQAAQILLGCQPAILGTYPNLALNTIPHKDIVQYIESIIEKIKPDYIFTHHPNDLNNDHYHVSIACQAASRLFQRKSVKRINGFYYMEILSSTDWAFSTSNHNFKPNVFYEVGEDILDIKIKALSIYRDVMREYPHSRSKETIKGLATIRGSQSGLIYAEAFESAFQLLNI